MGGRKILHQEPVEGSTYAIIRKLALAVYGGKCEWCGDAETPLQFDHVRGDGDRDRMKNRPNGMIRRIANDGVRLKDPLLQLLCAPCHRSKSSLETTLRAMKSRGVFAQLPTQPIGLRVIRSDAAAIVSTVLG